MMKFINLNQSPISVSEYSHKFNNLSKYASPLVADPQGRINKFVSRMYDLIIKITHRHADSGD